MCEYVFDNRANGGLLISPKRNFMLLEMIENAGTACTTTCKRSKEPENVLCLDCGELVCQPCQELYHQEHKLKMPARKMLQLRKDLLRCNEMIHKGEELKQNYDLWSKIVRIEVNRSREVSRNVVNRAADKLIELIQNIRDAKIQKIDLKFDGLEDNIKKQNPLAGRVVDDTRITNQILELLGTNLKSGYKSDNELLRRKEEIVKEASESFGVETVQAISAAHADFKNFNDINKKAEEQINNIGEMQCISFSDLQRIVSSPKITDLSGTSDYRTMTIEPQRQTVMRQKLKEYMAELASALKKPSDQPQTRPQQFPQLPRPNNQQLELNQVFDFEELDPNPRINLLERLEEEFGNPIDDYIPFEINDRIAAPNRRFINILDNPPPHQPLLFGDPARDLYRRQYRFLN